MLMWSGDLEQNYKNKKIKKNKFKLVNRYFFFYFQISKCTYNLYHKYVSDVLMYVFVCFVDFSTIRWKY